ncbi:hypothetical protein L6452_24928 [Arctium lappa]|uniref:Uncharacterized protein n=1 Tax=Arctium lappa TaxID=4217 RepID=A0ACB9A9J7_ARCLA|nr:hypothetical protein L6452_24928 [Arctium lappa]
MLSSLTPSIYVDNFNNIHEFRCFFFGKAIQAGASCKQVSGFLDFESSGFFGFSCRILIPFLLPKLASVEEKNNEKHHGSLISDLMAAIFPGLTFLPPYD